MFQLFKTEVIRIASPLRNGSKMLGMHSGTLGSVKSEKLESEIFEGSTGYWKNASNCDFGVLEAPKGGLDLALLG